MTAQKLGVYLSQTDLSRLSGRERARALSDLAEKINALSPEERRQARLGKLWNQWFEEMTEEEKGAFLEATLPSGFKQALASFEQQPMEKRKRAIEEATKRLRQQRDDLAKGQADADGVGSPTTNGPVLSEELQKKVALIGLSSVYSSSSAETKAELAPLLEEIQKNMESGRLFRGRD
jgi:hypothetical protein